MEDSLEKKFDPIKYSCIAYQRLAELQFKILNNQQYSKTVFKDNYQEFDIDHENAEGSQIIAQGLDYKLGFLSGDQRNMVQVEISELKTTQESKQISIYHSNKLTQKSCTKQMYDQRMDQRDLATAEEKHKFLFYMQTFYPCSRDLLIMIEGNNSIRIQSNHFVRLLEQSCQILRSSLQYILQNNTVEDLQIKERFLQIFGKIKPYTYPSNADDLGSMVVPLKRYKTTINTSEFKELLIGQWLSNTTIDFVCDYFMQKQSINFDYATKPNLIIPYRIFSSQNLNSNLPYFVELKKEYHLPANQSIFKVFGFIGIPINIKENHWIAIGVDTDKKIIHVFDSIKNNHQYQNEKSSAVEKLKAAIEKVDPNTSKLYTVSTNLFVEQLNGYDCGVFVLKFIQTVMNQGLQMNQLEFTQRDVTQFRKNLYHLIPMLCTGQYENGDDKPFDYSLLDMIENRR